MKGYVVCVYENIKDQEILKDYAVKAKDAVDKYRVLSNSELKIHNKYNSALIYTSIASGSLWLINGIHAYIVGPRPKKDIIQKWDVAIPKQK